MKKVLSILLAATMLIFLISGCSTLESPSSIPDEASEDLGLSSANAKDPSSTEPGLRLLMDILPMHDDKRAAADVAKQRSAAEALVKAAQEKGGPADVTIETLPADQTERETAITRLRTEIMSGGGPDLFIIGPSDTRFENLTLFNYPQTAMENKIFLPLDDYIAKAQFMKWDELLPVIMDAGKSNGEQQLLPLAYTFPITVFRKADFDPELSANMTWDDLRGSEFPELRAAAQANTNGVIYELHHSVFSSLFGEIADFSSGNLTFTEDELCQRLLDVKSLRAAKEAGEFDHLPDHYRTNLYVNFGSVKWQEDTLLHENEPIKTPIKPEEPITIIPCYNLQGGVTAYVSGYAGITRNTNRADDAFFLLDFLLSEKQQAESSIFRLLCYEMYGVPVNTTLMSKEKPALSWSLSEENLAELKDAIDQISVVQLRNHGSSLLDSTLGLVKYNEEDEWKEEVGNIYRTMTQELQE